MEIGPEMTDEVIRHESEGERQERYANNIATLARTLHVVLTHDECVMAVSFIQGVGPFLSPKEWGTLAGNVLKLMATKQL